MTEQEFVFQLRKIPFPEEMYKKVGLDDNFISKTITSYNPKPKKQLKGDINVDNPLVNLVNDYDLSKVRIGMVGFYNAIIEDEDYFYVGQFETDSVAISKLSHQVVIVSEDSLINEPYKCAYDSFSFLDSMIVVAKFLENCVVDIKLYENQEAINRKAIECAELAGGKAYLNFFKVLLGSES